ncbi:hypothetical protein AMELA_G00084290 [Ameiurus melas]|uniref:Uncharacterized protein n=1 Tax=Ameiurus melas TaxID=219545 RepID=A0A7J6B374_AMEME|nr:hypothetical protein AMELA_G00084290 [Ameiurus melas]
MVGCELLRDDVMDYTCLSSASVPFHLRHVGVLYSRAARVHSSTVALRVETQAAKSGVALDTADVTAPGSFAQPLGPVCDWRETPCRAPLTPTRISCAQQLASFRLTTASSSITLIQL